MTPEEKTKAMKLHLNSMYGKMATEPLYTDTDSFRKATVEDIPEAIEAIKEMKKDSMGWGFPIFGRCTVVQNSKPTFDLFCDAIINILEDAERKLNS